MDLRGGEVTTPAIPNYEASWDFLQRLHRGRPVCLTCISLDKKQLPTETFGSNEKGKFLAWIAAAAEMPANCYYSLAEPLARFTKKMERTDCKAVHYLHVDLDPRAGEDLGAEQTRILNLLRNPPAPLPPPSAIIFSGGGYQGLWVLAAPLVTDGSLDLAEEYKLFNLQLERVLGGDNCHDISRILRLPGTINKPDKKKQDKGRVPTLAEVVEWHEDRVYTINQFTKAVPAQTPSGTTAATKAAPAVSIDTSSVKRLRHVSELGAAVSDTLQQEIVSGPLDPTKWNFHESRNEWQFWVTCELVRAGVDDETIYAVLTDRNFNISKTIFQQHDGTARTSPEKYAIRQVTEARKEVGVVKPKVFLPNGQRQNRDCAAELGPLLRSHGVYRRGRTIVAPGPDAYLEPVKGDRGVTLLEQVAMFMAYRAEKKGSDKMVPAPALLGKELAKVLIESDELIGALPGITIMSRCPALIEENGQLVEVTGFHEPSGIYIMPGVPSPAVVQFAEASAALLGLLRDWNFNTDADKSRGFASLLKPALNESGMLGAGRCPMDLIEADDSQAGKGFLVETVCSIYRDEAESVTQKERGSVGSPSETLASALVKGHKFVNFDNWRGPLNIPFAESAMTQSRVDCRVPHQGTVSIDPTKTNFLMTSNGADLTIDMANRSNSISIRKQPVGYRFNPWSEGGLIEHVKANQPFYLGCVWAILREWHRLGKPLAEDEGQHDFRAWARATIYITRDLLGMAHPLDNYRKVQREKSTPALAWIRKVALAIVRAGRERQPLKASDLLGIIIDHEDIDVPGLAAADRHSEDEDTKRKALQGIGKRLGSAFAGATEEAREDSVKVRTITVDGKPVSRVESPGMGDRTEKVYIFGGFDSLPDYSGLGTDEGERPF